MHKPRVPLPGPGKGETHQPALNIIAIGGDTGAIGEKQGVSTSYYLEVESRVRQALLRWNALSLPPGLPLADHHRTVAYRSSPSATGLSSLTRTL